MSDETRLIEFEAAGAGKKTIVVKDVPEGLQLKRNHLRPISARRTQNGTLIPQTVWYNKKAFSLNVGSLADDVLLYFVALFESNEVVTFTVFDYTDLVFRVEYMLQVRITKLDDAKDCVGASRGWSMELEQV